jgi:glucokinase
MTANATEYVGLDVGGTYLKGARVDETGRVLARLHDPIQKDSRDALLAQLAAAIGTLEGDGPAAGVGIGLPGIVDLGSGRVRSAPNLPALNGLDLAAEISRRTGRRCFPENDANAAALAEAWLGAGRDAETVLLITLGTGVGGGLVFHGKIWSGKSGYAGEIGHIQVDPDGVRCGCGSWGCLETIAGIAGWVRRAEEEMASRPSRLRGHTEISPEVIVREANAGDAVAIDVMDDAARAVGIGIAASLNLLNLDRVVVGGGLARAGDVLLDRIVAHTRPRTFAHVFEDASFRLAELGADAGVVGAARAAIIGVRTAYA